MCVELMAWGTSRRFFFLSYLMVLISFEMKTPVFAHRLCVFEQ